MKRVKKLHLLLFIFMCIACLRMEPFRTVSLAAEAETVTFTPSDDASQNGRELNLLLNDDVERTIIFPESGTIKVDRALWIGSNKTVIANDCVIVQTKDATGLFYHVVDKTNYKSICNVTIQGGTWKSAYNDANVNFRFAHGSDITIDGCTIPTNYQAHGIELIACKNVTIKNCTVLASGEASSTSLEEAIQIDIASPATAPSCAEDGAKYVAGQTCENITVKNCTIRGSRGVCCNFTSTSDGKYLNKFHKNIKIIGNTITGTSSQALTLHNTVGFTVKNNTLITKDKRYEDHYSDGLTIEMFGNYSKSSSYKNVISGNTIKGGRYSIYMYSLSDSKYGTTTVKSNKLYCRQGAENAMRIEKCTKVVSSKNKSCTWK